MAFGQVQFHLIAFQDGPLEEGRELSAGQRKEAKKEALVLEKQERVEERRNLLNRPVLSTSFKKWIQNGSALMNKKLCLFLPVIKNTFIYLFRAVLGLHLLHRAFPSCGKWGLLSSCSAWVSHSSGFSYCRVWALGLQ